MPNGEAENITLEQFYSTKYTGTIQRNEKNQQILDIGACVRVSRRFFLPMPL